MEARQLGHGDEEDQTLPKLIEAMRGKRVVQVSAGDDHSLVLTESGEVYSFGDGSFGKLGHGDQEDQTLPKLIEAMRGNRVMQVSAGLLQSSVMMLKGGEVFECGVSSRDKNFHVLVPESLANAIVAGPTVVVTEDTTDEDGAW